MNTALLHALEATGFYENGRPATPTVEPLPSPLSERIRHRVPPFAPEVRWRSTQSQVPGSYAGLSVYFKYTENPDDAPVSRWQQEVWNHGFAPLLWVVSPSRVDLYNGFGPPSRNREDHLLDQFLMVEAHLDRLNQIAGRWALESGRTWSHLPGIDRATGVDEKLLNHLIDLESLLVKKDLDRVTAQALIGRSIFCQYLLDRKIVTNDQLREETTHSSLPNVLRDQEAAEALFSWLRRRFNGDIFDGATVPDSHHLNLVANFLEATPLDSGQRSLFPYRFDVIPIELISAIYEQFVYTSTESAQIQQQLGVHYTPLAAVSLVLDEVLGPGSTGDETVLDFTCGSGVFLVEALRRLVYIKSGEQPPSRRLIDQVLHEQIHGVDISEGAIRIAAFSLYLAALELDPDVTARSSTKFAPLINHTLHGVDAFDFAPSTRFDVIVGNPPWTFRSSEGVAARHRLDDLKLPPRSECFPYLYRALDFAHSQTRFGMLLSGTPFFGRSKTGSRAIQAIVREFSPVTLVNLSAFTAWLFPNASMPAMVLFSDRDRAAKEEPMTLVQARPAAGGRKNPVIEVSPSSFRSLPFEAWERNPHFLKTGFFGRQPDIVLMEQLTSRCEALGSQLHALGTGLRTGLTLGKPDQRSRDASHLAELPFLSRGLSHLTLPRDMKVFSESHAQWPRSREIYRAPLLLVGENFRRIPRIISAVAEQDLVFKASYRGASFVDSGADAAYLVAGILSSSLASWYVLMAGSSFGLWQARTAQADIESIPVPDLLAVSSTSAGQSVIRLAKKLKGRHLGGEAGRPLDDAVAELYGLGRYDRIIVEDGLQRASWQWRTRRQREDVAAVRNAELEAYAGVFFSVMDDWLSARGRRHLRAEIFDLGESSPIRIIRFVLQDGPGRSTEVRVLPTAGSLSQVLQRIGSKANVHVTETLTAVRELRVHAGDDVSVIKPAGLRNWLRVNALEDASLVLRDSIKGLGTKH